MMKNYVKPELFFESYELSQNIAACGWDMNQGDPVNCVATGDTKWGNPELTVFADANAECKGINLEGYCYENSADNITMKIFQS